MGFTPEPGWQPDPSWPPQPPGWQLRVSDDQAPAAASGAGPHGTGEPWASPFGPGPYTAGQPLPVAYEPGPYSAPAPQGKSGWANASFVVGLLGSYAKFLLSGSKFSYPGVNKVEKLAENGCNARLGGRPAVGQLPGRRSGRKHDVVDAQALTG